MCACIKKAEIARDAALGQNSQSIKTGIHAASAVIMKKSARKIRKKNEKFLLSILLASLQVLIASVLSYLSGISAYLLGLPLLAISIFLFYDALDSFVLILATALFAILMANVPYFIPFLLSVFMVLMPMHVMFRKGNSISGALREIGFNGGVLRAFAIALVSLVPTVVIMFILSYAAMQFNIDDSSLVADKLSSLPWYVILYAVTIGPLAEEIFFRSFLVRYMHPILANIAFAFAHFSYGSHMEVIGAFVIGLLLYIAYKGSGDLKTAVFLHMMINIGSVIMVMS